MSDAYWSNVVLNMRMEGANDGIVFIDDKGKTVTPSGNAKTSTTQFKYGASSLNLSTFGDKLALAASSDFDFGTSDFTWECWIYRTAVNDVTYADALWCSQVAPIGLAVAINSTGQIGICADSSNGGEWDIHIGADPGNPYGSTLIPLNTWTHVAVTRNGSTWRGFVNGVQDQTFTSSASISNAPNGYFIGHWHDGWVRTFFGYIEDLRITKGVARYTSNFTPPTAIWDGTEVDFNFNLSSASVTATSYPPSVTILQSFNLPSVDLSLAPLLPSYTTVIPSDQIFYLPAASLTLTPFDPVTYFKVNLVTADLELSPYIPQLTDLPVRWKINREAKQGITFQAAQSNFGEAYQQVAPKGLRSKEVTWQIQWIGLTDAEKDTVVKGLEGFGFHINLYWKAPYQLEEEAFLVKEPFKVTKDSLNYWKVEATLLRRYNAINAINQLPKALLTKDIFATCRALSYLPFDMVGSIIGSGAGVYYKLTMYDWDTPLLASPGILEVPNHPVDGHVTYIRPNATQYQVVESTGWYATHPTTVVGYVGTTVIAWGGYPLKDPNIVLTSSLNMVFFQLHN